MPSGMLSIAMITDDFDPPVTGVGIHVQKIVLELVGRGHRVVVVTTRRRGQSPQETWNGASIHRLFSIPVYGYYQALPLGKALDHIFMNHGVNVVHCHYLGILMLNAMSVAKRQGLPTVLTAHMTADVLTQPKPLKPFRPFLSYLIARLYERFSHVVCVSSLYSKQVKRFDVSSKIHFISNPVDFEGIETRAPTTAGDPFRVLFVGRLNPEKNVGLLVKAFSSLYKKHPSSRLLIAGQGDQALLLREMVSSLGIQDAVQFLGHVPHEQLPALYASADVFVLPSLVETQGLVALEAMRFQLPVIVTDRIIASKELVDDGENGYIVDGKDPAPLADRLIRLYESPSKRQEFGRAGRHKTSGCAISQVVDSLERVYRNTETTEGRPFDATGAKPDIYRVCPYCKSGTFDDRAEHIVVPSDAKTDSEEYFTVWRCSSCRSLHSYAKFSLAEYYTDFSYSKRTVNIFNWFTFRNFFRWVINHGVAPDQRILFCGYTGNQFKTFFAQRGYHSFDIRENNFKIASDSNDRGTYDALIVFDSLERVEHPEDMLEFVRENLKDGGWLFLLTADADRIKLSTRSALAVHQPYRLHIPSWAALEPIMTRHGFVLSSFRRLHYLDTWVPFVNSRSLHDLAFFRDGTSEAAFTFRPCHAFKKFWRIPRFVWLGLWGRVFVDPSNLSIVFRYDKHSRELKQPRHN